MVTFRQIWLFLFSSANHFENQRDLLTFGTDYRWSLFQIHHEKKEISPPRSRRARRRGSTQSNEPRPGADPPEPSAPGRPSPRGLPDAGPGTRGVCTYRSGHPCPFPRHRRRRLVRSGGKRRVASPRQHSRRWEGPVRLHSFCRRHGSGRGECRGGLLHPLPLGPLRPEGYPGTRRQARLSRGNLAGKGAA